MRLEAARGQDGQLPTVEKYNQLVKTRELIGVPIDAQADAITNTSTQTVVAPVKVEISPAVIAKREKKLARKVKASTPKKKLTPREVREKNKKKMEKVMVSKTKKVAARLKKEVRGKTNKKVTNKTVKKAAPTKATNNNKNVKAKKAAPTKTVKKIKKAVKKKK